MECNKIIFDVSVAVRGTPNASDYAELVARNAIRAMREPDPHAVAAVADTLNMDATKVAAVWMLLIEETLK